MRAARQHARSGSSCQLHSGPPRSPAPTGLAPGATTSARFASPASPRKSLGPLDAACAVLLLTKPGLHFLSAPPHSCRPQRPQETSALPLCTRANPGALACATASRNAHHRTQRRPREARPTSEHDPATRDGMPRASPATGWMLCDGLPRCA